MYKLLLFLNFCLNVTVVSILMSVIHSHKYLWSFLFAIIYWIVSVYFIEKWYIKREYNNGVCRKCGSKLKIEYGNWCNYMGDIYKVEAGVCDKCDRVVKLPWIIYPH